MTKLAIVYYSSYGTAHTMATRMAETAEARGAEVRLRRVRETAPDEVVQGVEAWAAHAASVADQPVAEPEDLDWADAVIMGSGTRYGHVTSQLQSFIDTLGPLWQEGRLADKVYASFTSSQTLHGGQETTILAMLTTFAHFGGIIVPPGYTDQTKFNDGNPYGVGVVTGQGGVDDTANTALDHLVTRVLDVAKRLES
ncbi:NAD(P)H:quinone oxidoreductase [Nocardioides sp. zg-1308]|uniref:NAD(P)H:quinone oxidoreductase n=1 Tax=Nocardioides renjunii TaxID=3095075 RepID=A0ABU5K9X8_9ACTN|nr:MULTISPECIES: NAD(P)H:quinone oxidoreductase [unclassified Nocardioides]MDZ5661697.1 NAD(P)H:quinone oxidoreductase [Nocardioides sp. S-58]NPD06601.1 NAD(P)H:quinone oxidoreductase [Nocardioides sp. zg-1308]WQQ23939.1 NAD(P)H:quinone oxidoreductase [Nocardioides sp. S-34]